MSKTGYYRRELEQHQTTARKLVFDEIEDEVNRLKDYIETIDLDSKEKMQKGIEYIKDALKELARKLY